jgi:hypothetical protein
MERVVRAMQDGGAGRSIFKRVGCNFSAAALALRFKTLGNSVSQS